MGWMMAERLFSRLPNPTPGHLHRFRASPRGMDGCSEDSPFVGRVP
jgi:hypothetical protein